MKQFFVVLVVCVQLFPLKAAAQAPLLTYEPSPVSALVKVCAQNSAGQEGSDCLSYIQAISDLYFLMNPQCSRPDLVTFSSQVSENIKGLVNAIPLNMRDKEFAATVVFQAVSRAQPCPTNSIPSAVDHSACQKGLEVLSNAWANDFMKQAALEKMRGIGCFK